MKNVIHSYGVDLPEDNFSMAQTEQLSVIGRIVTVTVDRPLGSYHPKHEDMT